MQTEQLINDFPNLVINSRDVNMIKDVFGKSVIVGVVSDKYYPYLNQLLDIIDPAPDFHIKARVAHIKEGVAILSPLTVDEGNVCFANKIIPGLLEQLRLKHE